jgi:thiol-disulfide isomerase/thioredoxin
VFYEGDPPLISLLNGEEVLYIEDAQIRGDHVLIPMHVFDASISARFSSGKMEGYWIKNDSIPFTAKLGAPRFKMSKSKKVVKVADRMNMTFIPANDFEYPGVGLFYQNGKNVTGTILTEVGDFRYFEGVIDKNELKMSTFDGTHAFMITGERNDSIWTGEMHFDDGYVEKWTGYADPEAELRDPFEIVELEKETHRPYLDIVAPANGRNSINTVRFKDKVVLIQLFGTWCPNSYDQTNYLVDWYNEDRQKDVEILAVSYEVKYSKKYGLHRIEDYKQDMKIPYEVVLGGRVSKEQAAMAFPFIKRLEAFPTLVILDKNGYARYVDSYFLGPASGDYYENFKIKLDNIIQELLQE